MDYSAKAVANYFLEKHSEEEISPLKIQKLVYIAHGWHLAFHDSPLVDDEYAEAWEYGPVFPSLYHEFKHYGRMPIGEFATTTYFNSEGNLVEKIPKVNEADQRTRQFLNKIWEVYGMYEGMDLSGMCHRENSPWDKARKNSTKRNVHIENSEIRLYYKEKQEQNLSNG